MSEDGGSDSWCTPKWLCELLGVFDLDPCSNDQSHVLARLSWQLEVATAPGHLQGDGLTAMWADSGSVFVNPPYSDPMPWCKRLVAHTGPWVALLKLDPSTKWWSVLMDVMPTVAPFRKRIKFERPGRSGMTANFPSVLVYSMWRPSAELAKHLWIASYARAA